MEIRKCYQSMIRAYPGGWDAMSAALGYSRCKLENLVYERGGAGAQYMSVNDALQMQAFSQTEDFASTIARISGGVFLLLPELDQIDNEDIGDKFAELVAKLGELSNAYREYKADNVITRREFDGLNEVAHQIHIILMQFLTLVARVYCEPEKVDARECAAPGALAKNCLCGESIA